MNKDITLTSTGEQICYHDYFKPFMCTSSIDMPKQYNQGWNSYRFVGGEPNFTGQNMPKILKRETNLYLYYECQIRVFRADKTTVSGYYYLTVNKETGEEREVFSFD